MKIRIEFSKHGLCRYNGHLDIMRYFQKAIRRAEIDIAYSTGFSPHQLMSFAQPLGVGVESDSEYLDIEVNSTYSSEEAIRRLNDVAADGIRVVSYVELPENAKNGMSIVACADYILGIKDGYELPFSTESELKSALKEFYAQDKIEVVKETKKSSSLIDIKPWIVSMSALPPKGAEISFEGFCSEKAPLIQLKALTGSHANLKPSLFHEAFYRFLGLECDPLSMAVTRTEVYANDGTEEQPVFKPLKDYGTVID